MILIYVVFGILGRWMWSSDPSVLSQFGFFSMSLPLFAWFYQYHIMDGRNYFVLPSFVGWLLNTIAVSANGGFMPVLNGGWASPHDVWIPMTDASNLWLLCDIIYGVSVGDFFIFFGLGASLMARVPKESRTC